MVKMYPKKIRLVLGVVSEILRQSKWKELGIITSDEFDTFLRNDRDGKKAVSILRDSGITVNDLEKNGFIMASLIFRGVLREEKK